jgi:Domain of unknown function (DUF1338)
MIDVRRLLDELWRDYAALNVQAGKIHALLGSLGERVVNDHVALRGLADSSVSLDGLARPFVAAGYREGGRYRFADKKLDARHYEPPQEDLPLVFVSELRSSELSPRLRAILASLLTQLPDDFARRDDLPIAGRPWRVRFVDYAALCAESEYAGWLAAFGLRANHFTVRVNALRRFDSLARLNELLEEHGFVLNDAGGKIKGSPEVHLEQSATLAEPVEVEFAEGIRRVPGCYYEFAKRYPLPSGELYTGFVERSADKIFESTDRRSRP